MSDDPAPTPPGSPSLLERLLPPVDPLGPDGSPKPSRMSPREQLVAAALGTLNVAVAAGTAGSVGDQQALILLAGLFASALTLVGARVGNRILTLVGLFATTLAQDSGGPLFLFIVLPFYAAAIWMFLKYNRGVKAQGALRRQQRADQRRAGTRAKPGAGRTAGAGGGKASGGKASGTPAAKAPSRSKRYTPPKARRKPPPPPKKPPRDRSIVD